MGVSGVGCRVSGKSFIVFSTYRLRSFTPFLNLPYRIPEVWLIRGDRLQIYSLQADTYVIQPRSQFFPHLDLSALLGECFGQAATQGSGAAIWELRDKLS